jgi:hypothetical protein
MHSFEQYNPLPELDSLIPATGFPITEDSVTSLAEVFAKGGLLVENLQDLLLLLKILEDSEYLTITDNTIKKVYNG